MSRCTANKQKILSRKIYLFIIYFTLRITDTSIVIIKKNIIKNYK